jgi:predicted restriction endonuclease
MPFGKIHARNPDVIALAGTIDRTPNALAMKMVNFASLDPTISQKGMSNVSKLDQEIWNEFFDEFINSGLEDLTRGEGLKEVKREEFVYEQKAGIDLEILSTRRINQDFFRKMVIASYDGKCALSGIDATELLVAGHIIPWSLNPAIRTDPRNGICLNYLYDRAFDRGLIAINEDYSVQYSSCLPEKSVDRLMSISTGKLMLPSRFRPSQEMLRYHRLNIFRA